jgi:UDP-N-acetylmuramoyl-tripeptide--D-alanyl-D-alanine ligase
MTGTTFKPELTPQFIAGALNLKTAPSGNAAIHHFTSVVTDSRKIHPGCLFIALKGEVFDGHDFIDQAVEQGAKGIIYQRAAVIKDPKDSYLFPVDDTVQAFRKIAFAWRREFSIPLIAVAGSVGKTTTKEILTALLRGKYQEVLKTIGSQNGFVGIPMTLMDLRVEHQAAVIEVGIDEIGAMKQHMELVGATAAVLTTIGAEHLEKLRDIPTVAQEEGLALSTVASAGGLIAISLDDPWIKPHAKTIRSGKKLTYSLQDTSADIFGSYEAAADLLKIGAETYILPLPGLHNARNLLAAVSIAIGLGLTPAEIRAGLKTFKPVSGRSEVKEIGTNVKYRVICDYYNANPDSTAAGLLLLSQLAQSQVALSQIPLGQVARSGKRFACLADMLELGDNEEKFHRDLSEILIAEGVEHVYLHGTRMKALQDELKRRNFSKDVQHFDNQSALAEEVLARVKAGDTVLIKGSHSMKMEKVFETLSQRAV